MGKFIYEKKKKMRWRGCRYSEPIQGISNSLYGGSIKDYLRKLGKDNFRFVKGPKDEINFVAPPYITGQMSIRQTQVIGSSEVKLKNY